MFASTTLVAVAVILRPAETARRGTNSKETLPFVLVETLLAPMDLFPSLPEGLEKNWIRKVSREVLLIPDPADPTRWMARILKEVQPYYWVDVFDRTQTL